MPLVGLRSFLQLAVFIRLIVVQQCVNALSRAEIISTVCSEQSLLAVYCVNALSRAEIIST